jgi:hypothetical protein
MAFEFAGESSIKWKNFKPNLAHFQFKTRFPDRFTPLQPRNFTIHGSNVRFHVTLPGIFFGNRGVVMTKFSKLVGTPASMNLHQGSKMSKTEHL